MRITQHNGRIGYAKHNDRDFDLAKSDHIDADRTHDNLYINHIYPDMSFEDAEMQYYRDHYQVALDKSNDAYIQNGHPERCRTIEDIYKSQRYRPEEIILQIGDKDTDIDHDMFKRAVNSYLTAMQRWNDEHGNHIQLLDAAMHFDETSPHVHIRRIWQYTDENGILHIGQNKALEMAGMPLPEPDKPRGRYNNRKMVFDAYMRDQWVKIVERNGYEVDKTPIPDVRHKDKEDFVRDKIAHVIDGITPSQKQTLDQMLDDVHKQEDHETLQKLKAMFPTQFDQMLNVLNAQERSQSHKQDIGFDFDR